MSKLMLTILIVLVLKYSYCRENNNFLQEIKNKYIDLNNISNHTGNGTWHPGNESLFAWGFLSGIHLFDNSTHKQECFSVAPDIHDDIADICYILDNLDETKQEYFEQIRLIITKIEHMFNSIDRVSGHCELFGRSVTETLYDLGHYLTVPEYTQKITKHFLYNIGAVVERYKYARWRWAQSDFYISGYAFGDLIKYVFFWDFA
jgi:hypothetical protein